MKELEFIQGDEDRKLYLLNIAIEVLKEVAQYDVPFSLIYDEAECDLLCLANDLEVEFIDDLDSIAYIC